MGIIAKYLGSGTRQSSGVSGSRATSATGYEQPSNRRSSLLRRFCKAQTESQAALSSSDGGPTRGSVNLPLARQLLRARRRPLVRRQLRRSSHGRLALRICSRRRRNVFRSATADCLPGQGDKHGANENLQGPKRNRRNSHDPRAPSHVARNRLNDQRTIAGCPS